MTTTTVKALCGKCHVAMEPVAQDDPKDLLSCPRCGVSDTRKNVLREVGEHAKEVVARQFQETLRGIGRRSKFLKVECKPIPKGRYRFISDMKP